MHSRFFVNLGATIHRNRLLKTITIWSPSWRITLHIIAYGIVYGYYANILHFTIRGNAGRRGDRIPSIFFIPRTTRLFICTFYRRQVCVDTQKSLPLNSEVHLEINQLYIGNGEYRYTIIQEGVIIYTVINDDAQQFSNVKVYGSNPWYPTAKAKITKMSVMNYL